MKRYPSIPSSWGNSFREFDAHVFDKLDGSSTRFQWSRKKSKAGLRHAWHRQGTRNNLFDETTPIFGPAIEIFHNTLAESVDNIARAQKWESVIVFCEFYGEKSFAGSHDPEDPKKLTLFDVFPYKVGQLDPKEFLKLFGKLDTPRYLGQHKWTRGYVQAVREGKIEGITREGVVGKSKRERSGVYMSKAKTQVWIDLVRANKGVAEAERIINS